MEGHDSGLEPEADDGQQDQGRSRVRRCDPRAETCHRERSRHVIEGRDEREDGERSRVRRDEVDPSRVADFGVVILRRHKEVRGDRHDLPSEEEENPVTREKDERH